MRSNFKKTRNFFETHPPSFFFKKMRFFVCMRSNFSPDLVEAVEGFRVQGLRFSLPPPPPPDLVEAVEVDMMRNALV